ncbi:NAD(P)H-hydrate dehydratase, partial [Candidatus Woesearchaeota archaeon]|nr:NAD(P)H-hydrate dehydratase [Candidatus Woesearchaeota archaeon]
MSREEKRPKLALPKRNPDSHKGQNGRVLVVGGSDDYVGAPALAGLAALRAGCDLVKIAAPEKAAWAINTLSPDLITVKLRGRRIGQSHVGSIVRMSRGFDAVLVGPGMSKVDRKAVNSILRGVVKSGVPIVMDADALKVADMCMLKNAVLTPHAKEFVDMLQFNRMTALAEEMEDRTMSVAEKVRLIQNGLDDFFAEGNVLLLKGRHDLVVSKDRSLVSKGGNAGMTVGGTGDILAGMCAGYLAQTADLFTSAGLASHNCKRIGDALLKSSNFG